MSKKPASAGGRTAFVKARGVQRNAFGAVAIRPNRRDLRKTPAGLQMPGDVHDHWHFESARNALRPPKHVSRTETGAGRMMTSAGMRRRVTGAWAPGRYTMLVVYRGASDVAAKGTMFVITLAAARQLSRDDFGLFALASTLGWLASVAADFGIQVHLARSVSQNPERAAGLLRTWLPIRAATGITALGFVTAGASRSRARQRHDAADDPVHAGVRRHRDSVSSSTTSFAGSIGPTSSPRLILVQRGVTGILALAALWWRPQVTLLAMALLLPAVATLALAAFMARRLSSARTPLAAPVLRTRHEFMTGVVPIGIGILLSALYFRVDVFLLERWSGTTCRRALQRRLSSCRGAAPLSRCCPGRCAPGLCRARDLRPVVRLAAPLAAAALGAASVLWLSAGWLVPALYGQAYADAAQSLRILLIALPLMARQLRADTSAHRLAWPARICRHLRWSACLQRPSELAVDSLLGIAGAAWATVWTEAFLTLGCVVVLTQMEPGTTRASRSRRKPGTPGGALSVTANPPCQRRRRPT